MIDNVPVWLQLGAALVLIVYVAALLVFAAVFLTAARTQERVEADRTGTSRPDEQRAHLRAVAAAADYDTWTETTP